MKLQLIDRKNRLIYAVLSRVNAFLVRRHFRSLSIVGAENIPSHGAFMLIANHTSRWDGLLVYHLINRPANFMVSPNELLGLQGKILRSMGAFPASTRFDLENHVHQQLNKGEGLVIFPEGDIYKDGNTHRFKSGAARFALNCERQGQSIPIVPVAIKYSGDGRSCEVAIAQSVSASEYLAGVADSLPNAVRSLTERLYREVCHLRLQLGSTAEKYGLFFAKQARPNTYVGEPTSA